MFEIFALSFHYLWAGIDFQHTLNFEYTDKMRWSRRQAASRRGLGDGLRDGGVASENRRHQNRL